MDIIERQEEIDGKWFTWVRYEGFNCLMFEDDHAIDEVEAQQKLADWRASQEVVDGTTN